MIHPSAIVFDLLLVMALGSALAFPVLAFVKSGAQPRKALKIVAVMAGLLVSGGVFLQLLLNGAIWMDSEAGLHAVSLHWLAGEPAFPPENSSEARYGLLYGPAVYAAYGGSFALFGANLLAPKLVGLLFFALACAAAIRWVIRFSGQGERRWLLAALVLTLMLPFGSYTYYPKAEPMLLAMACLPLLFDGSRIRMAIAVGLMAGSSFFVKANAPLAFVPLFAYLMLPAGRREWMALLLASAVAALAALGLCAVSFREEIPGYLGLLEQALKHGHDPRLFWLSLRFLSIPLAVLGTLAWLRREDRAFSVMVAVLAIVSLALALLGTKTGSGGYQLIPLLPSFLLLFSRGLEAALPRQWSPAMLRNAIGCWLGGVLVYGALYGIYGVQAVRDYGRHQAVVEEIRAVASAYPCPENRMLGRCASIGFAYGEDDPAASTGGYALQVMLSGGWQPVSDVALWDDRLAGAEPLSIPAAWLESCRNRAWLVQKGRAPFSAGSFYQRDQALFTAESTTRFQDRYRLVRSGRFFDVWECSNKGVGS